MFGKPCEEIINKYLYCVIVFHQQSSSATEFDSNISILKLKPKQQVFLPFIKLWYVRYLFGLSPFPSTFCFLYRYLAYFAEYLNCSGLIPHTTRAVFPLL